MMARGSFGGILRSPVTVYGAVLLVAAVAGGYQYLAGVLIFAAFWFLAWIAPRALVVVIWRHPDWIGRPRMLGVVGIWALATLLFLAGFAA